MQQSTDPEQTRSSRPDLRWQEVAAGVWTIEKPGTFPTRTMAVRLRDGGLLVISPSRRLGDAAMAELETFGRPRFLLAPNHYHNLGLGEWSQRYPDVQIVATEQAAPRLRDRVKLPVHDLSPVRIALPDGMELIEPPGLKNGEAWVWVKTDRGRVWIVSDGFFNVPLMPPGMTGLFCRLTGVAPGLRIGSTFLWVGIKDRKNYRGWILEQLESAPPTILIPGHGEVLTDPQLGARLSDLVRARV